MGRRKTNAKKDYSKSDATGSQSRLAAVRARGDRVPRKNKRVGKTSSQRGASGARTAVLPDAPASSQRVRLLRRAEKDKPAPTRRLRLPHEAMGVVLWCAALLTLLALATYDPRDASLNASGSAMVANWIGPAGAYWADLLFQSLGIGAFALGAGLVLAGWRAFAGRRVLPGLREGLGIMMLIFSSGAAAHIAMHGEPTPYPPGGIVGALLGETLLVQFALVGASILAGALCLLSLALTTDGALTGVGLRGLGTIAVAIREAHTTYLVWRERRHRRILRETKRHEPVDVTPAEDWTLGGEVPLRLVERAREVLQETPEEREARVAKAKERGRALAERDAARERQERRPRPAPSEPDLRLDQTVDLPREERFELGELPNMEATPARPAAAAPAPMPPPPPEDATIPPVPVRIRAAEPESAAAAVNEASPAPEVGAPQEGDAPVEVDPRPKAVVKGSRKKAAPEPEIVDVRPEVDVEEIERAAQEKPEHAPKSFELPSAQLLDIEATEREPVDTERLKENAQKLTRTLKHYGIEGVVREIRPGPVITMYEFVPAPGTKISKIASLADDLAMSMEALRVRIVAPIPGKGAVGIEIPNDSVETVFLKELITHKSYRKSKAALPMALGKDIEGTPTVADLTKMPHLLVAGATGSGKSVAVNAMIMSILYNATPEQVRLLMVDPKMLELSVYDGIPHLLLPVVTDPKKAAVALRWAVGEMERRYQLMSAAGVRNIGSFNKKVEKAQEAGEPLRVPMKDKLGNAEMVDCEPLPYIVIIVDELADLMMVASREVEASIMRLAQMARAAGLHLVLATQRPSVDVLTGVIKANFPTRMAFQVASKHDSRTILDSVGAEHLLGRGDMLFQPPGAGGLKRLHGSFVSDEEIERTVAFVKSQGQPEYDESILAVEAETTEASGGDEEMDEMYDQAVAIVTETQQASISMIQRRLRIGYNRAARLVETMEREGVVGPADGSKPREVLAPPPPT